MMAIVLLSTFLFCIGLILVLIKKNAIFILMGIELMLNASNINFVTFGRYHGTLDGQIFSLFVIVLAAAEVAIALALILKVYEHFRTSDLDDLNELKH